jgi:DNA-binding response OmpR family regulator
MLEQRSTPAPLLLSADTRSVRLFGKHFQLTELEFSLLHTLAMAKGEFLTREALLRAVWGEEGTNSLLSVYIHYLREKLERDGEKIILSSRGGGYALTKKLWEGEDEC